MKKTLLASAIALSIGSVSSVQALTITITSMSFNGSYGAAGTMNDAGNGTMTATQLFFGANWTADQQNWFDTHSSVLTWAGANTANVPDSFNYTFHLESNQVAAGTYFDWSGTNNIPVLTIYDCPVSGGGACTGISLPMATVPFPGNQPSFIGTTNDDVPISGGSTGTNAVPVPAAVWLMGSGLLGLVGVARRRKVA
jgi:hypothetical protein